MITIAAVFTVSALLILSLVISLILRVVVPTNMHHIVQTQGKTIVYGKDSPAGNVYYKWPAAIPKLGVVVSKLPSSNFQIPLDGYEAYDIGRLPFMVDVMAFFRVDDAAKAAQRIHDLENLRVSLHSVLQGAVRRILGTNNLEHILQDRSTLGKQFTEEVDDQLKEWGISTVKAIEFMDLRDSTGSKVILSIMEKDKSRIDRESRAIVADNRRAAETAEIEAARQIELQRQEATLQVETRKAQVARDTGIAKEQALQEVKTAAAVTAERTAVVNRVESVQAAEIAKSVAIVKAEEVQKTQQINAETQKQVQIIKADGEREATVKVAQGMKDAAVLEAAGIQAKGEAQGAAETALLMAPVNSQTALAREIGSNEGYQNYLTTVRTIESQQAIGVAMAGALTAAEVKVIANGGDVQSGVNSVLDLFTTKGGNQIGAAVGAMMQHPEVKTLVEKIKK